MKTLIDFIFYIFVATFGITLTLIGLTFACIDIGKELFKIITNDKSN